MRKKNLKFAAFIRPSRFYLQAIIALHTLASFASLWVDLSIGQYFLLLATIAGSLCYQLNRYTQLTRWIQVSIENNQARLLKRKGICFPVGSAAPQQLYPFADTEVHYAELLPKAWVLPSLIILYLQPKAAGCTDLVIFKDAISDEDFRRLKIFVLNGPLLKNASTTQGPGMM